MRDFRRIVPMRLHLVEALEALKSVSGHQKLSSESQAFINPLMLVTVGT